MKIDATLIRIQPQGAFELCVRENRGLLGALFDKINRHPTEVFVESGKLFYYPYYCAHTQLHLPRVRSMPNRVISENMVMEGGFGAVQRMGGFPDTQQQEVPQEHIVVCQYTKEQAQERIREHLKKKGFRKYLAFPDVKVKDLQLVYKPLYACLCRKGNKKFYKIIDAEVGERDYMLDIRYKNMVFHQPQTPGD